MVPLEVLKTSLFGYQKSGVEKYVARMKDEFNDRMIRDEMEHEKKLAQMQEQVDSLQKENQAKLAEQEAQHRRQMEQLELRLASAEQKKRELSCEVEKLLAARAQAEQFRTALEEIRSKAAQILAQDTQVPAPPRAQGKIYEFEAQ